MLQPPKLPDASPGAPPQKPKSVVKLAVFFTVLVCLAFIANDLLQLRKARQEQLKDTNVALDNMARALEQHAQDTIKSADATLIGIVAVIESMANTRASGDNKAGLVSRLAPLMAREIAVVNQIQSYCVFDANGHPLIQSTQHTGVQEITSREYFRFHKNNPSREAHVGPLIKNPGTDTWVITVSHRIDRADGSFAGVATAALDIEYFKDFYDTFDLGRDGVIFLGLNDGTTLVRRPLYEKYVGADLAQVPLYRDYIAKNRYGSAEFKSTIDGRQRLASYRRLERYPLFVFVALSKDEVLASWLEDTVVHSAGIAILIVALLFLGKRLVNQIRLRAGIERALEKTRDALNERNETLHRLALEDGLTALANRRHFDLAIEQELRRAVRHASPIALLMIDVDYFKQFNDLYGHTSGDACLRRIGTALHALPQRPGDIAARFGGDEFALLLPGARLEDAARIGELLRAEIYRLNMVHAGNTAGRVTLSIGAAALLPVQENDTAELLIARADKALYRAKHLGRNQVGVERGTDETIGIAS